MSAQRISFKVHGQVQGVNFRAFAQKQASSRQLTGWVSNTGDSKVIGEAQGQRSDVDAYLKDLNKGPGAAHVVKVEHEAVGLDESENDFLIR